MIIIAEIKSRGAAATTDTLVAAVAVFGKTIKIIRQQQHGFCAA
jgi:hypothetical protein